MSRFGTPEAIIGGQLPPVSTVPTPAPTQNSALGALGLSTTSLTAGTAAVVAITGATTGSTITGTPPDGMTLDSANRRLTGTPTTAGSYQVVLTETLAGATGSPRQTTVEVIVSLPGFYSNSAGNSAWKAAVARVKGGGRGKVLVKGDSTTVGQGAGSGNSNLVGARQYRPTTVLAGLLTTAGLPAYDRALVADNGTINGGINLSDYDPRVAMNSWTRTFQQDCSGGGYLVVPDTNGAPISITFGGLIDTLEVVTYGYGNYTYKLSIDGSALLTSNTGGAATAFQRAVQTLPAPVANKTSLVNTTATANGVALLSLRAYNTKSPALDFIVDASCGATAAQQASSGALGVTGWGALAHITFEAPDLVIANLSINDMLQGIATATTTAALQDICSSASAAGGGSLLIAPHPIDPGRVSVANQDANNAAIKALAAQQGVPCLSLYDYYGNYGAVSGMLVDGVHGNATFYAQVAAVYRQALSLMLT